MRCVIVVGYQNLDVADENIGGYSWLINTLPAIGVSKSEIPLSAWKITPPEGGLWGDYSIRVNTFGTDGQISGDYVYLDENNQQSAEPGWYTTESVDNWSPESADNVFIPFFEGVQIGSDCGAKVTFSGEVASESLTVDISDESIGGYTWPGNFSPVDLTLKDLAITPPEGGLWGDYSIRVNTFGTDGQISGDYVYLDENNQQGAEPGWYTTESVDNWSPESAGDVVIKSGEMFQIGSDCGAKITIPSAL